MNYSAIMHNVFNEVRHMGFIISPKLTLKVEFYRHMKYKLDLKNPKTFNEKLQWLKLYDHRDEYTKMVDKYEVRKYIAEAIGEEYLIPIYGVWEKFDDIDFDKLPEKFVLKCTHDSGGSVICTNKNQMDLKSAREKINKSLKQNYYYFNGEYPYKNVKPRIIAEQYMVDDSGTGLRDYKFFCFDGNPEALAIITDRWGNVSADFFDMEFTHMSLENEYKNAEKPVKKPPGFEKMYALSCILSKNIPHVRVDLYDINGKVYFGELTFFHDSGFVNFYPKKFDEIFGNWLKLPTYSIDSI